MPPFWLASWSLPVPRASTTPTRLAPGTLGMATRRPKLFVPSPSFHAALASCAPVSRGKISMPSLDTRLRSPWLRLAADQTSTSSHTGDQ